MSNNNKSATVSKSKNFHELNKAYVFPQDLNEPTKSSSLGFMLHLSGSTDILGVIVKCMQEVGHHFKLAGEDVSRELSITNALRIKDATRQMEKLMT